LCDDFDLFYIVIGDFLCVYCDCEIDFGLWVVCYMVIGWFVFDEFVIVMIGEEIVFIYGGFLFDGFLCMFG